MKYRILVYICLFLWVSLSKALGNDPSPEAVYQALASDDLSSVEQQLENLDGDDNLSLAYKGTLLMKRAGFESKPAKKLATFKEGKELLESIIKVDISNPELRFLRMIIQENAPKILGYNQNLKEDAEIVQTFFNELEKEVREAVRNYSQTSGILSPESFK